MATLECSPKLRAADPAFAGMVDVCNGMEEIIVTLREQNAALQGENATLRAQLTARNAA